ncbi:MAG: BMC domain-containing protein [Clostridia bacterium]|nr:BMC domain-containing protein [Clostridia bacterium]
MLALVDFSISCVEINKIYFVFSVFGVDSGGNLYYNKGEKKDAFVRIDERCENEGLPLDSNEGKTRIIQELVPGKQITLAHIIANPDPELYIKLGLDPADDHTGAIGIITLTPAETAIIAADIATKASGALLGFVDRFSGTLIVTGTVSQVESSVGAVCAYVSQTLRFTVCPITKT